jgi:hypothetical protein
MSHDDLRHPGPPRSTPGLEHGTGLKTRNHKNLGRTFLRPLGPSGDSRYFSLTGAGRVGNNEGELDQETRPVFIRHSGVSGGDDRCPWPTPLQGSSIGPGRVAFAEARPQPRLTEAAIVVRPRLCAVPFVVTGVSPAVSSMCRVASTLGLLCGLSTLAGCSGDTKAPAEIKGMSPAEYREKQEQALGSPTSDSPRATAKPGTRSR